MSDAGSWVPDHCEIILLDCSSRATGEPASLKPFLVLSPKAFNERTSHVIGLPLSNGNGGGDVLWFNPEISARAITAALHHYVPASRPKSLNWRQRGAAPCPARHVPDRFLANVCEVLSQIV